MKLHPVMMEHFGSAPESPLEVCLRHLQSSVAMVAVYGDRYGTVDDAGLSYTEREYDFAVANKIPIVAYFVGDDDQAEPRMQALRAKASNHLRSRATTPDDLSAKVAADLPTLLATVSPQRRRDHAPKDFVGRVQEMAQVSKALANGSSIAVTGMDGSGKTSFLLAVLDEAESRGALVAFVPLQPDASLATEGDVVARVKMSAPVGASVIGLDGLPPGLSLATIRDRVGSLIVATTSHFEGEAAVQICHMGPLEEPAVRLALSRYLPGVAGQILVPLIGGNPSLLRAACIVLQRRGLQGLRELAKVLSTDGLPDLPFGDWKRTRAAIAQAYGLLGRDEQRVVVTMAAVDAPWPEQAIQHFAKLSDDRAWSTLANLDTLNIIQWSDGSYNLTDLVRRFVRETQQPGRLDAVRRPHALAVAMELTQMEEEIDAGNVAFTDGVVASTLLMANAEAAAMWLCRQRLLSDTERQILGVLVLANERVRVAITPPMHRAQILSLAEPHLLQLTDQSMRASFHHSLGRALTHLDDFELARTHLETAAAIVEKEITDEPSFLLSIRGDLANLAAAEGNAELGANQNLKVAREAERLGFNDVAARCYVNAARAAHQAGKSKEEVESLFSAAGRIPLAASKFPMEPVLVAHGLGEDTERSLANVMGLYESGNSAAFVGLVAPLIRQLIELNPPRAAALSGPLLAVARSWRKDDRLALALAQCAMANLLENKSETAHELSHAALDAVVPTDAAVACVVFAAAASTHIGEDNGPGYAVRALSWMPNPDKHLEGLRDVRRHLAAAPLSASVAERELAYPTGPWKELDEAWRAYCLQRMGKQVPVLPSAVRALFDELTRPPGDSTTDDGIASARRVR